MCSSMYFYSNLLALHTFTAHRHLQVVFSGSGKQFVIQRSELDRNPRSITKQRWTWALEQYPKFFLSVKWRYLFYRVLVRIKCMWNSTVLKLLKHLSLLCSAQNNLWHTEKSKKYSISKNKENIVARISYLKVCK